ncbi:MAG: flavin-dependent oxidoreductase, F420-dependent methylene-tetrahydromethanopterin reductase [Acidimicrobiaceae bacterium]|nr:flavin-dependent oxidoreductase, F420-dependent methylene-tetrahydromethanopterin reductase [Acidimicrobiaceae bacterium]
MHVGVILPTFRRSASAALEAAAEAERAGLHGVFAYNHLWPMGQPGRPALSPFPILGAVAVRTERIALGTLVARIGLTPDSVLLDELLTLHALSGGRLVAGIGTGDSHSAAENLAYGVAFPPADERRERMGAVARTLLAHGVPTWIGGGSRATDAVARATGAVLNLWAAEPARVAAAGVGGEVTWGGTLPEDRDAAATLVGDLMGAGATWAVVSWPGSAAPVVEAASTAGVLLG